MVAALERNDDEIGDVIMKAMETPFVGGVSSSRIRLGPQGKIEFRCVA